MKSFNIGNIHIPVPVIQGGMGVGISLSGLASAVANMGGVGVISTVGIGMINGNSTHRIREENIASLRAEIRKARSLTKGILGVNVMSVITNFSDMVTTSIEEGIDLIFSGAGLPLDLPKYLKGNKHTKLVPIVSSARAARIITGKWKQVYDYLPDALVVEGPLAGGHLGFHREDIKKEQFALPVLLNDVLTYTQSVTEKYQKEIPVIAAGGIFSGGDIHYYLNRGASAVQMGTRFIATSECDADEAFKNAVIQGKEEDIRIIKSPVGLPGRAINNLFLEQVENGERIPFDCRFHCIQSCNPETTPYCIANALLSACRGNMQDGFAFTGANLGKVNKMSTVPEIFQELIEEYNQANDNVKKQSLTT